MNNNRVSIVLLAASILLLFSTIQRVEVIEFVYPTNTVQNTPQPATKTPTMTKPSPTPWPTMYYYARQTSREGLLLIAHFEGFRNAAYTCAAGKCTVGYGHQLRDGPCQGDEWPSYVTKEQGWALLEADVLLVDFYIFRARWELTQNEWDAISSIIFNMGWPNFTKTKIYTALNEERFGDVPDLIRITVCCVESLADRRAVEADLFEFGKYPEYIYN